MEGKPKHGFEGTGPNVIRVRNRTTATRDLSALEGRLKLLRYSLVWKEPKATMTRFLRLEGPKTIRVACARSVTIYHLKLCASENLRSSKLTFYPVHR